VVTRFIICEEDFFSYSFVISLTLSTQTAAGIIILLAL